MTAGTASLLTWSRAFPAIPPQAREARRFLAGILDGRPAADDAVLCLSEIVANAMIHSNSREPGGQFTVRAGLSHGGRLRVEVDDEGGDWTEPEPRDGENGRGLLIVSQLARAWGRTGSAAGWTVWFEIDICP